MEGFYIGKVGKQFHKEQEETTTGTSREKEDRTITSTPHTEHVDDLTHVDCRDYKKRKVKCEVVEYNFKDTTTEASWVKQIEIVQSTIGDLIDKVKKLEEEVEGLKKTQERMRRSIDIRDARF